MTALFNAGKPWTQDELRLLRASFDEGMDLAMLVERFGRTPYALISKLQELNRLTLVGYNYHRIESDPWVLLNVVRKMQDELHKENKT